MRLNSGASSSNTHTSFRHPLTRTSHYFEMEILATGKLGALAIGLAKTTYPLHRHPGWNSGNMTSGSHGNMTSGSHGNMTSGSHDNVIAGSHGNMNLI